MIKFLLTILVVGVLIVGGIYAYKHNFFRKSLTPTQTTKRTPSNAKNSAGQPLRDSAGLPANPATTSGKPVEDFVKTVKEDAKETSDLSVTACQSTPGVIKMKTGSKITIKNNDAKDITLRIAAGAIYTVPAGKSQSFDLKIEPAIYTYGCDHPDNSQNVAKSGVLYVEK